MTQKYFKAGIFDRDPGAANRFQMGITDLFASIVVWEKAEDMIKQSKLPDCVFVNLNLDQRDASFAFLETVVATMEPKPIIFAYVDASDQQLIAHATENGVQDVFTRPFDQDIIASKVNRFIRNEAALDRDLSYTKLRKPLVGEIEFSFKVISVDENGLTLLGSHYLSKGARFSLASDLIFEIFGKISQNFMVTKTWMDEVNNEFYLYAEPASLNEELSASLRRFILSKI